MIGTIRVWRRGDKRVDAMPVLKIEEHGGEREVKVMGERVTIGRIPESDVVLTDETVSRQHAEIVLRPEGYAVKDLGTRNGTWVNGKMIKEIILQDKDLIRVGTITLRFLSGEPPVSYEDSEEWLNNPATMIRPPQGPSIIPDEHKKLDVLYNISQATSSIFDVRELTEKVAEELLKVVNADRFLLMLKDEKGSEIVPQMAIGRDKREVELSISRTMVQHVTTKGVSILVRNALDDSRFQKAQSLISKNIRSILCAPLWSKEGIIGLIYVDSKKGGRSFSEDELELFTAIGNQVAVAFQNIRTQEKLWQKKRVERELEIAASIQQSFFPSTFPSCPNYNFGVRTMSAHNVGGDFYDCFNLSQKRIGVVIGDVSGKGIPAALYMARFISEFKVASVNFPKPAVLLTEINKKFKGIVKGGNFVSASYLVLELDTGSVTYALAGAHPILLYRKKEKDIKELSTGFGQILGVGEGVFGDESIGLECGDMAVVYTDGVIEAKDRDRNEFGVERLKEAIIRFNGLPADEIVEQTLDSIVKFSQGEELSDDLTLLVLKKGI